MGRRPFLLATGGISAAVTGCLGGGNTRAAGTTTGPTTWLVDLQLGQLYEFEIELLFGEYASGAVEHQTESGFETIVKAEVDFSQRRLKEFEVPETGEYSVTVATDGRAAFQIRRI